MYKEKKEINTHFKGSVLTIIYYVKKQEIKHVLNMY
jgi:hypothetical protein